MNRIIVTFCLNLLNKEENKNKIIHHQLRNSTKPFYSICSMKKEAKTFFSIVNFSNNGKKFIKVLYLNNFGF
jgi:hypothetical protein